MQRGALLALPLLLVATGFGGCGLLDGSSSLDEALESMPGTVDRVVFFDRARAVERLGLDDIDAEASPAEVDAYLAAARALPWRTELDLHLAPMLGSAPFSALDVEWEVVGYDGEGAYGRVWKVRDDVDLDQVDDYLAEPPPYLTALGELTVVADEHLIVSGPLAGDVLEAVTDEGDSLVDTGSFDGLLDSTDEVEAADLARGDAVCSLRGSRVRPELVEAVEAADLATPEVSGFFVHGDDGATSAVMVYDDDDDADTEAEAREDFLADGISPISGVPYSEFGTWQIDTDGDRLRIDVEYDEPRDVAAVIDRRDYPSICAPS